jgi:hypothetical protein
MRRSETGLNVPLNQRRSPSPEPSTAGSLSDRVEASPARPCWVDIGLGTALPGTVHAWARDPDNGGWQALVAVWLPAVAVRPRQPDRRPD